jgi:hypothetical protein
MEAVWAAGDGGVMNRVGRAIRAHLTYANIVATLALVVATGGTAAAAVIVTSNSQVAANTISGHNPPKGKHSNLIAGSVNATDLSPGVKSSFKVHCPAGLQRGGDLCFDPSPRAEASFMAALEACENANLRLPSTGELAEVYQHTGAPQPLQWTSTFIDNGIRFVAARLANTSSRQLELGFGGSQSAYRCVATPAN